MTAKLKTAGLEYHGDVTRARGGMTDADDPMSPAFVPVEERSPMGSARWWALRSKGRQRASVGVFDA